MRIRDEVQPNRYLLDALAIQMKELFDTEVDVVVYISPSAQEARSSDPGFLVCTSEEILRYAPNRIRGLVKKFRGGFFWRWVWSRKSS